MTRQSETTADPGGTASADPATASSAAEPGAGGTPSSDGDTDGPAATAAEDSPPTPALPLDQTFEILKNQRRRYVLQYLDDADGPVSLSDLAEQIAAWENGKEVREITSSERKRVYVGLYQCHLPKMAGMDVISFNKPRGIIEPGEHIDAFDQYLRPTESPAELSLNSHQLGLSILGIGLLPVVVAFLTDTILPIVTTVAAVLLLTVGAVVHLRRRTAASTSMSDEPAA
jgi:hypothetical protein